MKKSQFKVGDAIVWRRPYECEYVQGKVVAINWPKVTLKTENQTHKFKKITINIKDCLNSGDTFAIKPALPKVLVRKVYTLLDNDQYCAEFNSIKECEDYVRKLYDLNGYTNPKDWLSTLSIVESYKFNEV